MSKTVLIIDDSSYMRMLIGQVLTSAGFTIAGEAHDGETALSKALELQTDLITLDNVLPDMIGTDLLRILKEDQKIAAKVIMISAVGQENIIEEGMSLGATDYLVKPFTPEQLLEKVQKAFAGETIGTQQ